MQSTLKTFVTTTALAVAFTIAPTVALAQSVPTSAQFVVATTATSSPSVKIKKYKNCTALNKVFKHGVGKKGASDSTSSKEVTNFYKNSSLYKKNKHLDRDKDGIACEKR